MTTKIIVWSLTFINICVIALVVYIITKPAKCSENSEHKEKCICKTGYEGPNCEKYELYKYVGGMESINKDKNTFAHFSGYKGDNFHLGFAVSGKLLSMVTAGDTVTIADTSLLYEQSFIISGLEPPTTTFPLTTFGISGGGTDIVLVKNSLYKVRVTKK
jgi:hypothetical protein